MKKVKVSQRFAHADVEAWLRAASKKDEYLTAWIARHLNAAVKTTRTKNRSRP